MKTIKAFIKSHPVLSYYALAFAITWGTILIVIGVGSNAILATKDQYSTLMPFLYPMMLVGPSVAGILLTGFLYGRAGLRELLSRLLRWRVSARWYALALLTAPLSMAAVLLALSLRSPEFLPGIFTSGEKTTLLLTGIAGGLAAGIFEELGWTGFVIPRLKLRHSVLATGLFVGVLWGAWHILVNVLAGNTMSGSLPLTIYLPAILFILLVGWLPAFRVLMVWVYERTGSLLVAMLMHASLTASTLIVAPLMISGVALLTYQLAWAAALWVVVGAVAVATRGHLTPQPPLRRRVAQERSSTQSISS